MAKICIVMPYFKRQYQLNKTLQTIGESKHKDFSVIIVDDGSPTDIMLFDPPYDVEIIKLTDKSWTNCGPVYNRGFIRALEKGAEIVIIQSAECYHAGDILSHADQNITNENYIAYGCFQIDRDTTFQEHDILALSTKIQYKVMSDGKGLGENAWWNHSVISPTPQYWCCAITSKNLVRINGIDERFAHGYAYEDGWFVEQVKKAGLRIDICDYPFVVHQWHEKIYPRNTQDLLKINRTLWENLPLQTDFRSQHHITPDLKWNG